MFDDPELRRWMTDAQVVSFLHHTYGDVVKPGTVRQWVARNILAASGEKDGDGRRLFARDAVVFAYERHKKRIAIGDAI